jgi:hypothetical protein
MRGRSAVVADHRRKALPVGACVEELVGVVARATRHQGRRYYARYAREMDAGKRKAIGKELLEYMADKMYWNTISGSPFYMVAQPYVKGYVYNAEFEVHWDTVWLDK